MKFSDKSIFWALFTVLIGGMFTVLWVVKPCPDCPDAVVVTEQYRDGLREGIHRMREFDIKCLTNSWTDEQLDSASSAMAAVFSEAYFGPETFPESTLAYQWEHCGQIIDSLNQRLSGMVSITAVDSWVDERMFLRECGGDTITWIACIGGREWKAFLDSLKQAKGL